MWFEGKLTVKYLSSLNSFDFNAIYQNGYQHRDVEIEPTSIWNENRNWNDIEMNECDRRTNLLERIGRIYCEEVEKRL